MIVRTELEPTYVTSFETGDYDRTTTEAPRERVGVEILELILHGASSTLGWMMTITFIRTE